MRCESSWPLRSCSSWAHAAAWTMRIAPKRTALVKGRTAYPLQTSLSRRIRRRIAGSSPWKGPAAEFLRPYAVRRQRGSSGSSRNAAMGGRTVSRPGAPPPACPTRIAARMGSASARPRARRVGARAVRGAIRRASMDARRPLPGLFAERNGPVWYSTEPRSPTTTMSPPGIEAAGRWRYGLPRG